MTQKFIINIYCYNKPNYFFKRIPFEGSLQAAKDMSLSMVKKELIPLITIDIYTEKEFYSDDEPSCCYIPSSKSISEGYWVTDSVGGIF